MANQKKSDTMSWETNQVRQAQANAPAPKRKKTKKKRKKMNPVLSVLLYLICVALVSALLAGIGWLLANDLLSLNKAPVTATIVVEEGDSVSDVAQKLKDAGLINYKWFFCLTGKVILHADTIIEPGVYENMNSDMDYHALIGAMHHVRSFETVSVTIPEGKTVSEIFDILVENNVCTRAQLIETASNHEFENHPYLPEVDPEKKDNYIRLEGYLFPDTYEFYVDGDPVQVLDTMMSNFDRRLGDQIMSDISSSGYSMERIIILASIIEKESNDYPEERANISSVLYNRLNNKDRETNGYLQVDSTIDYALMLDGKDRTEFSKEYESEYNTYLYPDCPPGAICNPGLASIIAAVHPNDTDYYYFAAGIDGHSHFFETYEEHLNFINSDQYKRS